MKILVALALILFASLALAQPAQPVTQAKGDSITVFSSIGAGTSVSKVYDFSGYIAASVYITSDPACGNNSIVYATTSGNITDIANQVTSQWSTFPVTITNAIATPLDRYVTFLAVIQAGCTGVTVKITPLPWTPSMAVAGSFRDAQQILNSNYVYPAIVGALDTTAVGGPVIYSLSVDSSRNLKITGSTSVIGGSNVSIPGTISLAANTSGTICGLTAAAIYRFACSVAVNYRTGAATPTALTSDTPLGAVPDREDRLKMGAAETCIAAISSSAGTCYASLVQ